MTVGIEARSVEIGKPTRAHDSVRLGGIAGLLAVALGVTLNFVLIAPAPQPNAPLAEVAAYLTDQADALALSNTLRYSVFFLLVLFGVGLNNHVRRADRGDSRPWATMGLMGIFWIVAVGTVSNSVELAAAWQADAMTTGGDALLTLWSLGSVLFIVVAIAWATTLFGFSLAGLVSGVMPRWLAGYGLLAAVMALAGGVGVASALDGGWAQYPWFVASLLFLVWLLIISVRMVRNRPGPMLRR